MWIIKAYLLADKGYDVWITNCRGNRYSRKHITKNPDVPSSGFWKFSWTEIGKYDHPAVIDYILSETGFEKLYYSGHSQGSTTLFVLLSLRPEYNSKINVASLMAPIAYLNDPGDQIYFVFTLISLLTVRSIQLKPNNLISNQMKIFSFIISRWETPSILEIQHLMKVPFKSFARVMIFWDFVD